MNGRIPLSEILIYCREYEVSDREEYIRLIMSMDNVKPKKG